MAKWFITFIHLFDYFFTKKGINIGQMYAIVETKLIKDKRYTQLLATTQKKNSFYFILVSYTLLGSFMAYTIYSQRSFMVSMVFMHAYLMFMIGLTLIIDFSNIFLDTTDNDIIISKPVASNTFFFARVIHIIYYILQFVIVLSVAPITTIFYTYGLWTGLSSFVTTMITTFLTILTTYTLYLYVLYIAGKRRLKKIILFFQTVLVCLFIGGYQLIPFLTNLSLLYSNVQLFFWSYFLPPIWMAVSLEAVLKSNFDKIHVLMISISVFSVPCLFWVVNRFLAPIFMSKISTLNNDFFNHTGRRKESISILSNIVCKNQQEKALFEFTWKMSERDNSFLLQFLPSLAYMIFFAFLFTFKMKSSFSEAMANM